MGNPQETAFAPSFRVRLVAHASPRWRGARDAADADRRNLELSQHRANAVRFEIEKRLAHYLGAGASVKFDVTVEQPDGTVGVQTEARGSRDTLREAKGNRSDDALQRRRVDVIVESSQRISGLAGASRPLLKRSALSKFWHVNVGMTAGGSIGVAGGFLELELINDWSEQSMMGHVPLGGLGPKASLGTSVSIWSDPVGFSTDDPLDFSDFNRTWVQYTTLGFSAFIGYGAAYLSFLGLGSGAQHLDVGGFSLGTVGVGGATLYGPLLLEGPYPPTELPIKDSDTTVIPYDRTDRGKDQHNVLFSTGGAEINDSEKALLDSFLSSVVASKR
ncbi:MAG: hypothetical protein U1F42_07740 [Candidatus Competibacteraceae bacterium]